MHNSIGIKIPKVMLPDQAIDLNKWSIIACDQYTSNMDYWNKVKEYVGRNPSTLELVYPEVYLDDSEHSERISKITRTMKAYVREGLLTSLAPRFIYTERTSSSNDLRRGLLVALDLDHYDYNVGASSLIRATEGTVLDRLPPRVAIRREATLESPHIMVLFDDPDRSIIEPLAGQVSKMENLYDFNLMMNGGHIKGYGVDDQSMIDSIYFG
ncbi:MAG TPA: DUF1015 family protein, partial [Bacillota bacterium]|nr:DUF1015 family protein [Bacillota bacterium]